MVTTNKSESKRKPKPKKIKILRHAEYYDMQNTFDELFAQSGQGKIFDGLMDTIISRENILLAYRNIKNNTGSVTPGTDGLTMKNLAKITPDKMVEKVRNIIRNYTPRMIRRVDIPKQNDPSKTRPLGIPCIWDRLIQQCILQFLEPICEAKFSNNSYGFRPNRDCEQAIAAAYKLMQVSHLHYVIEVDIKGFFDNVDHSKLIKQIWAMGIRDTKLIYVIKRILKAPIKMPDGTIITPEKGTPQGGICSPILANICLNELDRWIESQWQDNPATQNYKERYNAGGSQVKSNAYTAMKKTRLKEMHIVRYADDFRIFCRSLNDAIKTMSAVEQWLKERLRLEISPEKTRVVNLKKQYSEFLGIKMRVKQKSDKFTVQSRVCDKAVKRIRAEAKTKVKIIAKSGNDKTTPKAIMNYNAFVMGEHNYYRMATDVTLDFGKIAFQVNKIFRGNRLRKRLKRTQKVKVINAVTERYGESKQLRYISNYPIAPIGYVQTKAPMCKKRSIQKYTPDGREEIHKNLGVNTGIMLALMRMHLYDRSMEYADNRISLYCAQYGKCAVTGRPFEYASDIHCHHKLPRKNGGKDNYQNLVLVLKNVHSLIHAKENEIIAKYLSVLSLDSKQIQKLNKFREQAGNKPVTI